MTTAIIILSAAILLLIISLGYANTRRRQAENLHADNQGYIKRLQEENVSLKNQSTELFESLQMERAAHQATISKLQDIQSTPPTDNQPDHVDEKAFYHEMVVGIVKDALGGALEKGLTPALKSTINAQMQRINEKTRKADR